jgi:hypothetical protein
MAAISFNDEVFNAAKQYAEGGAWETLDDALRKFYGSTQPWTRLSCERVAREVRKMQRERDFAKDYKQF